MAKPVVYITRTEAFSSSHRLHSKLLSDDENRNIFGKCNNSTGHGHNYKVSVTVRGTVDPVTGMVLNVHVIKVALMTVLDNLDHHNIDLDIPYFHSVVSTAENIAVYVWKEIKELLSCHDVELYEVKIFETDKNTATYRGEVQ